MILLRGKISTPIDLLAPIMAIGFVPGDFAKDAEGQETLGNLGQNMAWILKKIKGK